MAEFCYQCTEYHFGDGSVNDFKDLSNEKNTKEGLYISALCEGCGITQVDHSGMCIHHNTDCIVAEQEQDNKEKN